MEMARHKRSVLALFTRVKYWGKEGAPVLTEPGVVRRRYVSVNQHTCLLNAMCLLTCVYVSVCNYFLPAERGRVCPSHRPNPIKKPDMASLVSRSYIISRLEYTKRSCSKESTAFRFSLSKRMHSNVLAFLS